MIAIFNTILAYKLLMMMINQGTKMQGVINKAYMEKFKPVIDEEGNVYIIANVRVTLEVSSSSTQIGQWKIIRYSTSCRQLL